MYHRNPRLQKINNKITYILSRILAPLVIIYSATLFYDRYEILRYFERTEGKIVSENYETAKFSKSGVASVSFKIEFNDRDAQKRFFYTAYSQVQSDRIGETVDVLYDPTNPDRALFPDLLGFYITPLLALLIGIFMWWWGGIALTFKSPLFASQNDH